VGKDIAFGPRNLGLPVETIEERVNSALLDVGVDADRFRERSPFHLSEGEKRKIAIAGVLAMQPRMLVFDEPTAGLDPRGVRRFTDLIKRLLSQEKSILIVTHNMDFVAEVADRVLAMSQGRIVYDGAPRHLFNDREKMHHIGLVPPTLVDMLSKLDLPIDVEDILSLQQLKQRLKELNQ